MNDQRFLGCFWYIFVIIFLGFGCSKNDGGNPPALENPEGDGSGRKPAPEEPKIELNTTRVSIDNLGDLKALSRNCVYPSTVQMGSASRDVVVDGHLEDWRASAVHFSDHPGDSRGGLDLENIQFGLNANDLFIGMKLAGSVWKPEKSLVTLEFLQGYRVGGSFVLEANHTIRIQSDEMAIFEHGAWHSLPLPFLGDFAYGEDELEVRLDRSRFIDQVVNSPVWGLMVSVGDAWGIDDFGSMALFPGRINKGYDQFAFSGCLAEDIASFSLNYQSISNGGPTGIEELVRYTETIMSPYLQTKAYPVMSMPILVSSNQVSVVVNEKIKGAMGVVQNMVLPIFRGVGSNSKFSLGHVAEYKTEAHPEILSLENAVSTYLDHFLWASYRHSSVPLRKAVVSAVQHTILARVLPKYYLLESMTRQERGQYERLGLLLGFNISGGKALGEEKSIGDDTSRVSDEFMNSAMALLSAWTRSGLRENRIIAEAREKGLPDYPSFEPDLFFWEWLFEHYPDKYEALKTIQSEMDGGASTWSTGQFLDADYDGLPKFMEESLGTFDDQRDSDRDGWSDLSEWMSNHDPKNAVDRPNSIAADGLYGDFLDLIPGKIKVDDDGECEGAGDIKSYVAIIDSEKLILGLKHDGEKEEENDIYIWKLDIEVPKMEYSGQVEWVRGEKYIQIKDSNGGVVTRYRRPRANGISSLDAVVWFKDLPLAGFDVEGKLKLSVSLKETGELCDDTPWFSPLLKEQPL